MPVTSFSEFFDGIKNATIDFGDIFATIKYAFDKLLADGGVAGLKESLASIMPFMTYIFLALGFVEALKGQKFIGVQKFLLFAIVGYASGALVVSGLIDDFIKISPLVLGIVLAVVFAVLYKTLYVLSFIGFIGYSVYMVCYSGAYFTLPTTGSLIPSLVLAAVVVIIALAMRPTVERLATSAIGAWVVLTCLLNIYDFTALLPSYAKIVKLVVFGIVFIFGFIWQHRHRKRY